MTTKLEQFLQDIAPEHTLDTVAARCDEALAGFAVGEEAWASWKAFEACLGSFYCRLENHVLRLTPPRDVNHWMDWGRCCHLLGEAYGAVGHEVAFEMACTGYGGGMHGVLKVVAARFGEQIAQDEIAARASAFWEGLDVGERLRVSEEYLEKFGELVPSNMRESGRLRIQMQFWQVLAQHPRTVQQLRRVGR